MTNCLSSFLGDIFFDESIDLLQKYQLIDKLFVKESS